MCCWCSHTYVHIYIRAYMHVRARRPWSSTQPNEIILIIKKKHSLRRAPFMCIVLHCPVDEGKNSPASPTAAVRVCIYARRVSFQKPREAFWHHLQQSCDFCHSCMWRRVIHDCAGVLFHIWIFFSTNFSHRWKWVSMDAQKTALFILIEAFIKY